MRLTVREIRFKHEALQALGSRTLPGRDAEKKVATLLRMYFMKAYQLTDDLINKALEDIPIPDDYDGDAIPARVRNARGIASEEVHKQEIDIRDIPDNLKITEKDLPKESKRLEENQRGVASIIALLGPELYDDFDETEEKEADEYTPKVVNAVLTAS